MSAYLNPWTAHAGYISVGCLRNILSFGDTRMENTLLGSSKDPITSGPSGKDVLKDSKYATSVQQIYLLRSISELNKELIKIQKEKSRTTLHKSTADLTDCHYLESLLSLVEDMCHHLQNIIHNKAVLINHCQEAHEDHMTLDAEYHNDLVQCFPLIAKQLGQLSLYLDSIRWANKLSMNDSNVANNCKILASRLAKIQSFYQTLEQGRALMRKRIRKKQE